LFQFGVETIARSPPISKPSERLRACSTISEVAELSPSGTDDPGSLLCLGAMMESSPS
jgi:hypothetical protein